MGQIGCHLAFLDPSKEVLSCLSDPEIIYQEVQNAENYKCVHLSRTGMLPVLGYLAFGSTPDQNRLILSLNDVLAFSNTHSSHTHSAEEICPHRDSSYILSSAKASTPEQANREVSKQRKPKTTSFSETNYP